MIDANWSMRSPISEFNSSILWRRFGVGGVGGVFSAAASSLGFMMVSTTSGFFSTSVTLLPVSIACSPVTPLPANGSKMLSPSKVDCCISARSNSFGFSVW